MCCGRYNIKEVGQLLDRSSASASTEEDRKSRYLSKIAQKGNAYKRLRKTVQSDCAT